MFYSSKTPSTYSIIQDIRETSCCSPCLPTPALYPTLNIQDIRETSCCSPYLPTPALYPALYIQDIRETSCCSPCLPSRSCSPNTARPLKL